jgi:hypothetical protein
MNIKRFNQMFESVKNKSIKTYEEFKNSIITIDEFIDNLKIKVDVTSNIFYHFSLSVYGFKFINSAPCLKYDTDEYILEKTILPRKQYWYEQYIESSFEHFIKYTKITNSDIPLNERLYVYIKTPLEPISFNSFNFRNGSMNYEKLKSIKLFDRIDIRGNNKYLYRVK